MEKVVTKESTKAKSADSGYFFHFTSKMLFAMGDDLSYGLNTLGPLCLWQCFSNSRAINHLTAMSFKLSAIKINHH